MSEYLFLMGGVLLSGIALSISPCPLATNIAAVSFLARQTGKGSNAFWAGILYALGRMTATAVTAFLILQLALGTGETFTRFLGITIHGWLGPAMIFLGMLLTGIISFFPTGGTPDAARSQALTDRLGIWSAFPLGVIFALAFCPTSAAAFLAMLGIAAKARSPILFPALFGLAAAFPVLLFGWILAFQTSWLAKTFEWTGMLDWWVRHLGGTLFILIGIWFSLRYVWFI